MAIVSRLAVSAWVLLLPLSANAAVRPIERLSTGWLQELYQRSLAAKERAQPVGICVGAQGTYAFEPAKAWTDLPKDEWHAPATQGVFEALGEERLFVTVMDALKAAVAAHLARHQDTQTRLGMITAGHHDVRKPGEVEKFVLRAVAEPALARTILERADEFGPSRLRLYHSDAAYGRRETGQQSLIAAFAIVDTARGELFVVGDGDCEF
jgi:hypothetical protein